MSAVSIQITPAHNPVNPVVPRVNGSSGVAELTQPLLSAVATPENIQPKEREWIVCSQENLYLSNTSSRSVFITMLVAICVIFGTGLGLGIALSSWWFCLWILIPVVFYIAFRHTENSNQSDLDQRVSGFMTRIIASMKQAVQQQKGLEIRVSCDLSTRVKIEGELSQGLPKLLEARVSDCRKFYIFRMTPEQIQSNSKYQLFQAMANLRQSNSATFPNGETVPSGVLGIILDYSPIQ